MNPHSTLRIHCALVALLTCLLAVSPRTTVAQTYQGRLMLVTDPTQLEANVYPLSNRLATINVIFNNPAGGEVRVIIRDGYGTVYYDDYSSTILYRQNFDLSQLPAGAYTVILTRQQAHFARTFTINPPALNRITLSPPYNQNTPDSGFDTGKRLTQNR